MLKKFQTIKTLLFDLDGTLSDSAPGIIDSVAYALDKMNVAYESKEELRRFVGPPLREEFMKFCHNDSTDWGDNAVKIYREYYTTKGIFENSPYDGVPEMIDVLFKKGLKLAVATSKPEVFARQIVQRYGFSDKFEFIGGSLLNGERTDKAEVIKYVLDKIGANADECIMVGDRSYDILGGKKCGTVTVGVLWGYGTKTELQSVGANIIVKNPKEIVKLFD